MIQLVFLLVGVSALKPIWRLLALAGTIWIALGFAILLDLSDGRLSVAMDTLAILFVVEGLIEIAAATSAGLRQRWIDALRGAAFLAAAALVFDAPWDNNIAAAMVFGAAFLADGTFRICAAFVIHHRRWRVGIVAGLVEVGLAAAILASWPVPHRMVVPFCFALLLLTSGYALIRMALPLRRAPEGGSVTAQPLDTTDSRQDGDTRPTVSGDEASGDAGGDVLNVHVWTPVGSAENARRRLLVDRYVAAVDGDGVISTGHAALEMPPELYISHYPANDIDHSPDDFRALLSAGPENDVPGRFNESLAQEAADWCMPDKTVTFRRFDPQALRRFWAAYAQDKTYNLTARNCSTSVIQALDAAMEGAAYTGRIWRDLFNLLCNPQFWLMRLVRGRAEAMTWTPGLVLDYARLLRGVVERGDRSWRTKLQDALRARRMFAHVEERAEARQIPV